MRPLILIACLFFGNLVSAEVTEPAVSLTPPAAFQLETRDDSVCKIEADKAESLCYRRANAPDVWPGLPDRVELVAKIKRFGELSPDGKLDKLEEAQLAEIAPAYFLKAEDREYILKTYREIEVSNMGLDLAHVQRLETQSEISFLATVTWRTLDGREGALHAQGLAIFPAELPLDKADPNQALANLINLGVVSETATPPWPGDPSRASTEFLKQVLGPAIGGGYYLIPIARAFAEAIGHMFEAIGKAIGQGINDTVNQMTQEIGKALGNPPSAESPATPQSQPEGPKTQPGAPAPATQP